MIITYTIGLITTLLTGREPPSKPTEGLNKTGAGGCGLHSAGCMKGVGSVLISKL